MEHLGQRFCKKRTCKKTGTVYYNCVSFRKGCEARLIVKGDVVRERNKHSCDDALPAQVIDVRAAMSQRIRDVALTQLNERPTDIWELVIQEMREQHPGVTLNFVTKTPAVNMVKNVRARAVGHDVFRAIESVPTRNVSESDTRPFLQFNTSQTDADGRVRRMIGFGHPDLVRLLRYPQITLFVDGTFKIVPVGFSQCLIIMAHDPSVDVYVPVFYILVDGKSQDIYWNVLNMVIIRTDRRLEPAAVTCDFERGLINAVVEQFPRVSVVGCLFHFKQALRRKMIDLKISGDQISDAMTPGKLDVLTVIPKAEILDKGIRFVRSVVNEENAKKKWDQFWSYFRRTWVERFDASLWNVEAMVASGLDIVNRTNNPLEKYNRDLAGRFKGTHPSLLTFVEVTKEESVRYASLCDDIRNNRADPPQHATAPIITIPQNYVDFI